MITVIIPTLNEERWVAACLERVRQEFSGQVIVTDGGSTDGTQKAVAPYDVEWVAGGPGLALQCNRAVERAGQDRFFFVSADCRPGRGWMRALRQLTVDPVCSAGGFRLTYSDGSWAMGLIAFGGNFRSRFMGITLPDQGLYTSRDVFESVGGFCPRSRIPFARYCLKAGQLGAIRLVNHPMLASSRGFARPWATVWRHFKIYREFHREESSSSPRLGF